MQSDINELSSTLEAILNQSVKEGETLSNCLMRQEWHKFVPNTKNVCICDDHQLLGCLPLKIVPGRQLSQEEVESFTNHVNSWLYRKNK